MSEEAKTVDKFQEDWVEAKAFWERQHRIYDFAYLQYKSILTYNSIFGHDYLRTFGMKVFVPHTFQAIESIAAVLNARKVEVVVESSKLIDETKEKYLSKLDNIEWKRAKMNTVRAAVLKDALTYGLGFYFNPFVDDSKEFHFQKTNEEKTSAPSDPEDGREQGDEPAIDKKAGWEKKKITRYRGMKPRPLDPYYTFPDPNATSDEDWGFCYAYTPMSVEALRDFVVSAEWMSQEEAEKKINETSVEYFDKIRDTVDNLFEQPLTAYTRGDHVGTYSGKPIQERSQKNRVGLLERFEEDGYEARIAGTDIVLHQDYNIYPHKRIPIIPVWDYKIPHYFPGMGEPEIMRWQQIEANRVHNSLLEALLMSVVQRYAVNTSLLEDESDIAFQNPFKPIRLKKLPGITVQQAIMPMPQPDVKQSPFQLMNLIKETIQQTTGASDFIVSSNDSTAGTATESDNLVQATTNRMREKTRQMDEETLPKLFEQWHACFPVFYTDELDFRLRGERLFVRYLPYDRRTANEDPEKINKAKEELDAEGDTLVAIYQNAGYDEVIFLSDLMGEFAVEVRITDLDLDSDKAIMQYMALIKSANEANIAAQNAGDPTRINVMKLEEDLLKQYSFIKKPEDYIIKQAQEAPALPGAPMPEPGTAPGQVDEAAPIEQPTGAAPAAQEQNAVVPPVPAVV